MDHVKIGLVTEIEVFESAGALVKEVQVPSRQPGNVKSPWVRISRGVEQDERQFVLKDIKDIEHCFRLSLRAADDREHRRKVNSHR